MENLLLWLFQAATVPMQWTIVLVVLTCYIVVQVRKHWPNSK